MSKKGKRKKWAMGKKIIASTYVATASQKKKMVLIKTFMKVFSDNTGIKFRSVDIETDEKKFRITLTYRQMDSEVADLGEIFVSFLCLPEIDEAVQVNLDGVVINVQGPTGEDKAKLEAISDDIYQFKKTFDLIEFVSSWAITKIDESFQIEEALLSFKMEDLNERIKGMTR